MSPAELEVQQLKAKAVLTLLRDRNRKMCVGWLGGSLSEPKKAPIHVEWKVEPSDLARHLWYWQRTSALTRIGMTPFLAELMRQHRKLEGTSGEPPASKNKLLLVVWNLAATIQAKVHEWQACVTAQAKKAFVGAIVVRTSDLVPLWTWETDLLRHRPALVDVCDRMLSMELWQYRQQCGELTKQEKKLARGGQVTPYLTPLGLRWPPVTGSSSSTKSSRAPLERASASSSTGAPGTIKARSQLTPSALSSMGAKPLASLDFLASSAAPRATTTTTAMDKDVRQMLSELSMKSKPTKASKSSAPVEAHNSLKSSEFLLSEPPSASKFIKFARRSPVSQPATSRGAPSDVFAGETFCVSGPFTVDQKEMLALISHHGGSIAPTVNRRCTYLVADRIGSAKTKKAQANGIPVVTEAWVRVSIAKGKKSTKASLFANDFVSSSSSRVAGPTGARPTGAHNHNVVDNDDIDSDESEDGNGDADADSADEIEEQESEGASDSTSNSNSDLNLDLNSDGDAGLESADERRRDPHLDESSSEEKEEEDEDADNH